jgi:hypothetical protein
MSTTWELLKIYATFMALRIIKSMTQELKGVHFDLKVESVLRDLGLSPAAKRYKESENIRKLEVALGGGDPWTLTLPFVRNLPITGLYRRRRKAKLGGRRSCRKSEKLAAPTCGPRGAVQEKMCGLCLNFALIDVHCPVIFLGRMLCKPLPSVPAGGMILHSLMCLILVYYERVPRLANPLNFAPPSKTQPFDVYSMLF